MDNYLIFLDVDGTLLDSDYKNNFPQLSKKLKYLQKKGNIFALNSNRALEDLLPVANEFNILGPLVCENGVFAYFQNKKKVIFFVNKREISSLIRIKKLLEKMLLGVNTLSNKKMIYKKTDTVNFIKTGNKINIDLNSILILNNKFRKFTISAHVKKCVSGKIVNDFKSLQLLVKITKDKVKKFDTDNKTIVTFSKTFCNLLVFSKLTTKKTAVEYLLNKFYPNYKVIVIGDEKSDAEMIKNIGEFWTVANASNKTKNIAKRISSKKHTEGVYELLSKL